jgi:hypothetical protein
MFWRRRRYTRRVLEVLAAAPAHEMDAVTLANRAGIRPARIYPVLVRLRQHGWIVSRWSNPDKPDVRERGPLLYRASTYGLWVSSGRSRRPYMEWWPESDRPPA